MSDDDPQVTLPDTPTEPETGTEDTTATETPPDAGEITTPEPSAEETSLEDAMAALQSGKFVAAVPIDEPAEKPAKADPEPPPAPEKPAEEPETPAEAPETPAAPEGEPAPEKPTATAEPPPTAEALAAELDKALDAITLGDSELPFPTEDDDDGKIKSSEWEERYPSISAHTKAMVKAAIQAAIPLLTQRIDATSKAVEDARKAMQDVEPTIARIREERASQARESLVNKVAELVPDARELLANKELVPWIQKQSPFWQDIATKSGDPRDQQALLERFRQDMKIPPAKPAAPATPARKPKPDGAAIAATTGLRKAGIVLKPSESGAMTRAEMDRQLQADIEALTAQGV